MPSRALTEQKSLARPQLKAPSLAASLKITLPAMTAEKSASAPARANEPLKIGEVRALPQPAAVDTWTPVEGGIASHALVQSEGALGIRVKLELSGLAGPVEVRVQGNNGVVESMVADPARGSEAWTPWTEGSEQMVEVFSATPLDAAAVRIAAVVHFTDSPFTKAAASCTISTACSTGDAALDAAMAERKKSSAKMSFVDGTSSFLCSGTLINTERFPQPFFMTAHHCVNNQASASSLTTFWFYEDSACGTSIPGSGAQQLAGGAELIMTNAAVDGTLLRLNEPPPAGAVFAGWSRERLQPNMPVFSISHPKGDTSRWALGNFDNDEDRWSNPAMQQFNSVRLTRGFIEGGSSGSGLYTLSNGSFQFRGTLLGHKDSDTNPYSCTNLNSDVVYGRFDIFEPQIDQYIRLAAQAPDDAPNRARDLFTAAFSDPTGFDRPLNERSDTLALDNRRIDYVGDIDVYRFRITSPAWVSTWTEGEQDTIGMILDSRGVPLASNDDWQAGLPYNFGITKFLNPGTYYVQVAHFEATGTGTYHFRMRADMVDANYTALWWNASENGWGFNVSHQGNNLFGTLYTYDANGAPIWFSMSDGLKQPDGSYAGQLVTSSGPVFSSTPWNPNAVTRTMVGTMRVSFVDNDNGILTYTVNGESVSKLIKRLDFAGPPTCTWSASNRSNSSNMTDLWWGGPSESGWGVNFSHQGSTIFATLFTYDANGRPLWFSMSDGKRTANGSYSGPLYRSTGPAFNAVPFTPITPANLTQVGTMTLTFTDGNTGTMTYTVNGVPVTKRIQRLEAGAIKPLCSGTN